MLTNKCEYKPPACILQTVNLYEYKSEEILHLEHQYQLTLLNDFKKKNGMRNYLYIKSTIKPHQTVFQ